MPSWHHNNVNVIARGQPVVTFHDVVLFLFFIFCEGKYLSKKVHLRGHRHCCCGKSFCSLRAHSQRTPFGTRMIKRQIFATKLKATKIYLRWQIQYCPWRKGGGGQPFKLHTDQTTPSPLSQCGYISILPVNITFVTVMVTDSLGVNRPLFCQYPPILVVLCNLLTNSLIFFSKFWWFSAGVHHSWFYGLNKLRVLPEMYWGTIRECITSTS